ncbi:MAG: hypothetical protein GC193_05300 [Cryomorphaceae bacterium]|nr:hypothetical protein [Cryomorphaceae bacterium]
MAKTKQKSGRKTYSQNLREAQQLLEKLKNRMTVLKALIDEGTVDADASGYNAALKHLGSAESLNKQGKAAEMIPVVKKGLQCLSTR